MCMCGDTYCFSCGPAQGNSHCYQCGAWEADGGCEDPEWCKAERDEEPKPKKAKRQDKTPHLGLPLFKRSRLEAHYPIWRSKLHSPSSWIFVADLHDTCTPIFDECDDTPAILQALRSAGVLQRETDTQFDLHKVYIGFDDYKEALAFIQRLNQYLLDHEVDFPQGYRSQRQTDYETFMRLKKQYGWI